MYILTIDGREEEGAYSVLSEDNNHVLYIFEEEDDASRFAMMLEENEYPKMYVMEVEDELILKACNIHGYEYSIITKNDLVIPPETANYDFI